MKRFPYELTITFILCIYLFIYLQGVYGRFGKKPNEKLIDAYEQFVLGNCDNLKMSRILKVTLSR